MKKVSLATILALSTMGMAFFANAADNAQTNAPAANAPAYEVMPCGMVREYNPMCNGTMCNRGYPDGRANMRRGFKNMPGNAPYMGMQMGQRGGFVANQSVTRVADAGKWEDDQMIVLEGNIIKRVGRKDYVFKDGSGELEIEISRRAWHGDIFSADDRVRLVANVEKSWGKTEVLAVHIEQIRPDAAAPSQGNKTGNNQ